MNLIVAVDENWAIGYKGDLLAHVPIDLKYFKAVTTGKNLVLGRKTLESFPNGLPLPNRHHFLLSRSNHPLANHSQITLCNSIDDLQDKLQNIDKSEIFVVGGGEIYKELLPFCSKAYVTKLHEKFTADTFFPNLDEDKNWNLIENDINFNINYDPESGGIATDFLLYEKK